MGSMFLQTAITDRPLDLWQIHKTTFTSAKYVDFTHAFSPTIPVRSRFSNATRTATVTGADIAVAISFRTQVTVGRGGRGGRGSRGGKTTG